MTALPTRHKQARDEVLRLLYQLVTVADTPTVLEMLRGLCEQLWQVLDPDDPTTLWEEMCRWIDLKIDAPRMGQAYGPGIREIEPELMLGIHGDRGRIDDPAPTDG